MKFFIETADLDVVRRWSHTSLIDGVLTTPALLKEGAVTSKDLIMALCEVMDDREVFVDVTETDPKSIYEQTMRLAELAENIVVKIPCAQENIAAIEKLVDEGIVINVTFVFSVAQALMMAKLGVSYISPCLEKCESREEGLQLVNDIREIYDIYEYETEIVVTSMNSVQEIGEVALHGADASAVSVGLLENIFKHPLTDQAIDEMLRDCQIIEMETFR